MSQLFMCGVTPLNTLEYGKLKCGFFCKKDDESKAVFYKCSGHNVHEPMVFRVRDNRSISMTHVKQAGVPARTDLVEVFCRDDIAKHVRRG